MNLFYDPLTQAGRHELAESEARHLVQVLRRKIGDVIDLVDGQGRHFRGPIIEIGKKRCSLDLELITEQTSRTNYKLTLAIAPTKQIDRLEWLLEKATEIGIDTIQPILCRYSERKNFRADRLERILESAMKQSLQSWLPKLQPLLPLEEVVAQLEASVKLMAYIDPEVRTTIADNYRPGQDVCMLVGPEGGFHPAEAAFARQHGFQAIWLGPNRLRTETAGLVAVQSIAQLNLPTENE